MRVFALFVFAVTLICQPVWAEISADELSAQKRLEQERIAEKERLERVAKRVKEVKAVEKDIAKIDGKILKISQQIKALKDEIDSLNSDEEKARKRLQNQLDAFNQTAVSIARLERMPIEAMTAASSMRAAHNRKGVVEGGRKSLSREIDGNRSDIYELQSIRQKRSEKFAETEKLRQSRMDEKGRLEKLFRKQVKLLAVDDAEKANLMKKAYAAKQEKTLSQILSNYKSNEIYMPKTRQNLKRMPVQGKIVRGYNQKNEAGIRAQGVSVLATSGEDVVAIQDGRVIYSDDFREYGYIVILEHEDGTHSLYSGMKESNRELGDYIHAGKKIGIMPSVAKPELYLEIRRKGKTINPSQYLASK